MYLLVLVIVAVGVAVLSVLVARVVFVARSEWVERADHAVSDLLKLDAKLSELSARTLVTRSTLEAATDIPEDWKTRRAKKRWLASAVDRWQEQNCILHKELLGSEIRALVDYINNSATPDGVRAWPRQATVDTRLSEGEWAHLTDAANLRSWGLAGDCYEEERAQIDSVVADIRHEAQRHAAEAHAKLFDSLEIHPLTANQVDAVTSNESNNLVVAGAGSGKTSVMVARAAWLVKSGQAEPSEILLLAYNRAAATELKERLERYFGPDTVPECRTFHSLGLSILQGNDVEDEAPKISELADESNLLGLLTDWLTQEITNEEVGAETRNGALGEITTAVLVCSPASIWSVAPIGYGPSPPDPDAPPHIPTFGGYNVRSIQEAQLSNFMFMLGYHVEYEQSHISNLTYQPDWYLGEDRAYSRFVYLEHFGIDRRGHTRNDIDAFDYNRSISWKREFHGQVGTQLLETYTYDFMENAWHGRLLYQLNATSLTADSVAREQGSQFHERIGMAASKVAADLAAFIRVARESRPQLDDVERRLQDVGQWSMIGGTAEQWSATRNNVFFNLAREALSLYESQLKVSGEIDFVDMCAQATQCIVDESRSTLGWRHILVDEFQDITRTRAELIEALLTVGGEESTLFAVGDDWQSIYSFAGADVSIMTRFEGQFGRRLARVHGGKPESYSNVLPLQRTFRFPQNIADVSGRIIMANSFQISKMIKARTPEHSNDMEEGIVLLRYPGYDEDNDDSNPLYSVASRALRGIARHAQGVDYEQTPTVMILARYWHVLDSLVPASLAPELEGTLRFTKSTIHASKGLEADYVILAGVNGGRWGFPPEGAEFAVARMLLAEMSSVADPEERRLMYVALTRARRLTMVLAEESSPGVPASQFARDLMEDPDVRCPEYRFSGELYTGGKGSEAVPETPFEAQWRRLRNSDAWGAVVTGSRVRRGDRITITAKDGRVSERTVLKCVWEGDDSTLVSLAPEKALDGGPWLPNGCPHCGGDPSGGSTCWESGLEH